MQTLRFRLLQGSCDATRARTVCRRWHHQRLPPPPPHRQWLSCAHIGLGAFLTFASNLSSLVSVQLILKFYLGNVAAETFELDSGSILVYTFAYSAPIVLASTLCYFFLPADKEVHWKWKVLALCLLVTFSGLAFVFVGNSPLGMTVDPIAVFYNRKLKDYLAVVTFLAANYFVGYVAGRFFGFHPTICRTLSIEVAMQNDWLALHVVRGTSQPLAYIFPVLFYSTMQASCGPLVMAIFKHMYQSERVLDYVNENMLHDSFRGPGHFDAEDAAQVSLQSRHNQAVSRILGVENKRRYGKPIWHLSSKVKSKLTRKQPKTADGSEGEEYLIDREDGESN